MRVRHLRVLELGPAQIGRGRGRERRCRSQPTIVADAGRDQRLRHRDAGRADAGDDDADVLGPLADDLERVDEGGERDDRGAVLVVVEDGDVELLAQAALDLEAARRGDVLEVDPAEDGRDRRDGADDLVDVLRRQADRPRVDVRRTP